MLRNIAFALSLPVLGALPLRAQTPADSTQQFIGTWEGTYQADHGPAGAFKMAIIRDGALKATVEMTSGTSAVPTTVTDVKIAGNTATWTQALMGMSCKSSAVLSAGTLRGETVCAHGSMGFLLRKRVAAAAPSDSGMFDQFIAYLKRLHGGGEHKVCFGCP
ncbi:MAG: hypothetical protein ABJD07_05525 [Gemmatimonadaceae bacterium]